MPLSPTGAASFRALSQDGPLSSSGTETPSTKAAKELAAARVFLNSIPKEAPQASSGQPTMPFNFAAIQSDQQRVIDRLAEVERLASEAIGRPATPPTADSSKGHVEFSTLRPDEAPSVREGVSVKDSEIKALEKEVRTTRDKLDKKTAAQKQLRTDVLPRIAEILDGAPTEDVSVLEVKLIIAEIKLQARKFGAKATTPSNKAVLQEEYRLVTAKLDEMEVSYSVFYAKHKALVDSQVNLTTIRDPKIKEDFERNQTEHCVRMLLTQHQQGLMGRLGIKIEPNPQVVATASPSHSPAPAEGFGSRLERNSTADKTPVVDPKKLPVKSSPLRSLVKCILFVAAFVFVVRRFFPERFTKISFSGSLWPFGKKG